MMLNNEKFVEIIQATPLVSIDLILENENQQVLLGRRNNEPAKNYWFVPGGRVQKNEPLSDAFQRICLNELNIDLDYEKKRRLGVFEHFYENNFLNIPGISTHYVVIAYALVIPEDKKKLIKEDTQHNSLMWWNKHELIQHSDVHPYCKAYFS